jgi:hypothetical protein
VEEGYEHPEQPTKDRGPDPLAGEGSGDEDVDSTSEREAEEEAGEDEE